MYVSAKAKNLIAHLDVHTSGMQLSRLDEPVVELERAFDIGVRDVPQEVLDAVKILLDSVRARWSIHVSDNAVGFLRTALIENSLL